MPVVLNSADLKLYYNKVCGWCIQPLYNHQGHGSKVDTFQKWSCLIRFVMQCVSSI